MSRTSEQTERAVVAHLAAYPMETYAEIARTHGVSDAVVYRLADENGLVGFRGTLKTAERREIRDALSGRLDRTGGDAGGQVQERLPFWDAED